MLSISPEELEYPRVNCKSLNFILTQFTINGIRRPDVMPGRVSHRGNVTPDPSGWVAGPAACKARRGPDGVPSRTILPTAHLRFCCKTLRNNIVIWEKLLSSLRNNAVNQDETET